MSIVPRFHKLVLLSQFDSHSHSDHRLISDNQDSTIRHSHNQNLTFFCNQIRLLASLSLIQFLQICIKEYNNIWDAFSLSYYSFLRVMTYV